MRQLSASNSAIDLSASERVNFQTMVRFRLELWLRARLLPFRVAEKDLADVLKLARPSRPGRYRGLSTATIAAAVLRTTRHPWMMRDRRCLRQGLLGAYFLTAAGHEPELHFAVGRSAGPVDRLTAHCWVEIAGSCVVNTPQDGMTTIWVERQPAEGERQR